MMAKQLDRNPRNIGLIRPVMGEGIVKYLRLANDRDRVGRYLQVKADVIKLREDERGKSA
jgi:hypothetical protein